MPRYIAFLRAINVGGHTVRMTRLCELFESLGLADVSTFIASGNVVFDAPSGAAAALETTIERHLHAELGYEVATFLRTPAQLAAIAAHEPFDAAAVAAGRTLSVAFLKAKPDAPARRQLLECRSELDELAVHGREAYWLCRTRTSDSRFTGARLEKLLRGPATLRNVTTVRKLAEKYGAAVA